MQFDFSGVKKVRERAFSKSGLKEVCLSEDTEVVSRRAFYECKKLSSVIWNCKCNVIPVECFVRCSNLTKFDFSSVKKIEAYAFWRSGLTSVTLSKKMKLIKTVLPIATIWKRSNGYQIEILKKIFLRSAKI